MSTGYFKCGYELDLANYGAKFLGEAHIEGATLYGIGHRGWDNHGDDDEGCRVSKQYSGVGLRLTQEGEFDIAHGELWEVPSSLWRWLDDIEQNGRYYERKIVPVHVEKPKHEIGEHNNIIQAWVYEHCYKDFKYTDKIEGGKF